MAGGTRPFTPTTTRTRDALAVRLLQLAVSVTVVGMDAVPVGRIGDYIKEQRESARLSLRRLAQETGISNPYLSQIERGLRKPSAEILQQIAKGLRISAEQIYVQAGLLEDKGLSQAVQAAVMTDPTINERQKRVLLDIYSSFLSENETARATAATSAENGAKKTAKKATKKTAKKATKKSAQRRTKTTKKSAN